MPERVSETVRVDLLKTRYEFADNAILETDKAGLTRRQENAEPIAEKHPQDAIAQTLAEAEELQAEAQAQAQANQEEQQRHAQEGEECQQPLAEEQDQVEQAIRAHEDDRRAACAVFDFLRSNGFKGDACTPKGILKKTYPLHTAASQGDAEMVELLLRCRADSSLTVSGQTPLGLAEKRNRRGSHDQVLAVLRG